MAISRTKMIAAIASVATALCVTVAGTFAYFTDSASVHAGIQTSSLSGSISQPVHVNDTGDSGSAVIDSANTWIEGTTSAPGYSALNTDVMDAAGIKTDEKTYTVGRGNSLLVGEDGNIKGSQAFSVSYSNTGSTDEKFYPEIIVTAKNGMSLEQYKNVLSVADADAVPKDANPIQYQDVLNGTGEDLLSVETYTMDSVVDKVQMQKDGSLSFYLKPVTVKPGESITADYVLTLSMDGHLDYTVPEVTVSADATIRPSSFVSPWYGTPEKTGEADKVSYTLAPDYQTRVLWQGADGVYTVRGGKDAITVTDAENEDTQKVLEYAVAQYNYSGASMAPTAYLLGSETEYQLYVLDAEGSWKSATDAVEVGSYKAVVTPSADGFAVSHTEFYFDIVNNVIPVTFENGPTEAAKEDWAQLSWDGNDATRQYDGTPVDVIAKDPDGNQIPVEYYDETGTTKLDGAPTDAGKYVVKPVSDAEHQYIGEAHITITPINVYMGCNPIDPSAADDGLIHNRITYGDKTTLKLFYAEVLADGDSFDDVFDISGLRYLMDGDTVVSPEPTAYSTVGGTLTQEGYLHIFTIDGVVSKTKNYTITYNDGSYLFIKRKRVTVTPTLDKPTYNLTDAPVFGYEIDGLLPGDEDTIDDSKLMYRVDGEKAIEGATYAAGTHSVMADCLISTTGDYAFDYQTVDFTVGKKTVNITFYMDPDAEGNANATWDDVTKTETKTYDTLPAALIAKDDEGNTYPVVYKNTWTGKYESPVKGYDYTASVQSTADTKFVGTATVRIYKADVDATTVFWQNSHLIEGQPINTDLCYTGFLGNDTPENSIDYNTLTVTIYHDDNSDGQPDKDAGPVELDDNGSLPAGYYYLEITGQATAENYYIGPQFGTFMVYKS